LREFLIYTSAGDSANVKQWYKGPNRNYDIWVTSFSDTPNKNAEYADYYNEHRGLKFPNLYNVFLENRSILSSYKAVMVLDDDIIIPPRSISKLFELLIVKDLWLLQPAFSRLGIVSHEITKRRLFYCLRYTNFVEVACPIFRTHKLLEILDIY